MKCPYPCWYAYMEVPGNHKTRVHREFMQLIKDLHAMCIRNKNSIVARDLCRGGRWLEEIVREHSVYLDVAATIGGYPETKKEISTCQRGQGAHRSEEHHRLHGALCG